MLLLLLLQISRLLQLQCIVKAGATSSRCGATLAT
jgi:hypothetical protein